MEYVMVPVPAEHEQEVLRFLIGMAARAGQQPWEPSQVEAVLAATDDTGRTLVAAVADAVLDKAPLSEADAAAALMISRRELVGLMRELNELPEARAHGGLLGHRKVVEPARGGGEHEVRLLGMDLEAAKTVRERRQRSS